MQIVKLPISQLETNIGQIPDLPMNPRQWTKEQVETLAKSLRETPELFEARPVLVVPYGGKYVILGGNMRYEASKSNGEAEVPAIVFPADMPVAKMKEIVVKDNGAFGAWDWDALANEWDDLPLGDWGVPAWKDSNIDEEAVNGLFEPAGESDKKVITIAVKIPEKLEDKIEDIKAALRITLDEWPGCSV